MKRKTFHGLAWFLMLALILTSFTCYSPAYGYDESPPVISSSRTHYSIGDVADLHIQDGSLAGNTTVESVTVIIHSTTDTTGTSIDLTETEDTGTFSGNILLSADTTVGDPGQQPSIKVSLGNQVKFTYTDNSSQIHTLTLTIIPHPIEIQVYNPDGSNAVQGSIVLKESIGQDSESVVETVPLSPQGTCTITPPYPGDFRFIAFPDTASDFGTSDTLYFNVDEWGTASKTDGMLTSTELTFRRPNIKGSITDSNGQPLQDEQYDIVIGHEDTEDTSDITCEFVIENGIYAVLGLTSGRYVFKAASYIDGQADSPLQTIEISEATPFHRIDLALTENTISNNVLPGQVQGPDDTAGIESSIRFQKYDSDWQTWRDTDQSGNFSIDTDGLDGPGNYYLEAIPMNSSEYTVSQHIDFSVTQDNQFSVSNLTVKLRHPVLTAMVLNPDGSPASEGDFIIHRMNGEEAQLYMILPVKNGTALIPSFEDGRYAMVAYPSETNIAVGSVSKVFTASEGTFTLEGEVVPTDTAVFDYQKADVKGTVTYPDGTTPVNNWDYDIWTMPSDHQDMDKVTKHLRDGSYIAGGFTGGRYRFALISYNMEYADTWYDIEINPENPVIDRPLSFASPQIKGTIVLPGGGNPQEGWISILDGNMNPLDIGTGIRVEGKFRVGGLADGTYFLRVDLPNLPDTGYAPYAGTFEITIDGGVCSNADAMNMTLQMAERTPRILNMDTPVKGSDRLNLELENASKCDYGSLVIKISGNGQDDIALTGFDMNYYDEFRDVCYYSFDFTPARDLPYGDYTLSLYEGSTGTLLDSRPTVIACHVLSDPSVISPASTSDIPFRLSVDTFGGESAGSPWQNGESVKIRLTSDAHDPETYEPDWVYETTAVVASESSISFTLPQGEIPLDGLYYINVLRAVSTDVFLGFGEFEVGNTQIREIMAVGGDKMITFKGDYLRKYMSGDACLELYMNGELIASTTEFNNFWGELQWFVPYRLNSHEVFTVKLFANGEWVSLEDGTVKVLPTLSCDNYLITEDSQIAINAYTGMGWRAGDEVKVRIRSSFSFDAREGQLISPEDLIVTDNKVSFSNSSSTNTSSMGPDNPGVTFPLATGTYMLDVFNAAGERVGITEIYVNNTSIKLSGVVRDEAGNPADQSLIYMESMDGSLRRAFMCGPDGRFYFFSEGNFGVPSGTYRLWAEAPYFASGAKSTAKTVIVDEAGFKDENNQPLADVALEYNETQISGRITLPSGETLRQGDVIVFLNDEELFKVPVGIDGSYKIGGLSDGAYTLLGCPWDEGMINAVPVHITVENGVSSQTIADMQIRNAHFISGTLSLPAGRVAPQGGLIMNLAAFDDNGTPENYNDDMYYWQPVTITEGTNSADYTVKVAGGCSYRVRFFADSSQSELDQFGYVISGIYSQSGTVFNRAQATLVSVDQTDVSGIDIELVEGKLLTGTISLPEGASIPEGEELLINVTVMMNNATENTRLDDYGYVEDITLTHDQPSASYIFRVPENPEGVGYTLDYFLPEPHPVYSQNGYYSESGTVSRFEDLDRIDVRSGNAPNKNLILLAKEAPMLMNPEIDASGSRIIASFSKPMDEASMSSQGFVLTADNTEIALDPNGWQAVDDGDDSTYIYSLSLQDIYISKDDADIRLGYDGTGSISSLEGIPLGSGSFDVLNRSELKLIISGVVPGSLNNHDVTLRVSSAAIDLYIKSGSDILASGTGKIGYVFETDGAKSLVIGSSQLLKTIAITFTVDKTAPGVSVTQCDSVTNNPNGVTPVISFTGDYVESTRTITLNGERYTIGTAIKSPGHYVLIASVKDTAGNVGKVTKAFDIVWDTQAPIISSNIISGNTYKDLAPEIILSSASSGETSNLGSYTYSIKITCPDGHSASYTKGQTIPQLTDEGLYRLEVRAVNPSYTEIASEKAYEFTIDKNSPSVAIMGVNAAGIYNTPVTPVISLSDTVASQQVLSTNATIILTRDGNPVTSYKTGDTILLDGLYVLSVGTMDNAEQSASASISFRIDSTKPVITVSGALNGVTYNNTDVTLTAAANEGTLSATSNGQPASLVNDQILFTGEPNKLTTYFVVLKAEDSAHNVTSKEITFTIDRLPVNIVINGISEGQLINYTPVISYIVYDGEDEKSGAAATLDGNPYSSTLQLSDGIHSLEVKYVEGDTTTAKTVRFIVDKTAPAVSNISLLKGDQAISQNTFARLGNIVKVKARIIDTNGLSQVSFSLGTAVTGIAMNYNEASGLYEGLYTVGGGDFTGLKLVIKAADKAGNSTENKSFVNTVTIDNTKPLVSRTTTPAAPDGTNGVFKSSAMAITLMGSSPADTLYYTLNNTAGQAAASKILTPVQGDNVLTYYAVDQAGNKSDEKIFVLKYDNIRPAGVSLSSVADELVNTPKISLSGSVSGEGSTTRALLRKQDSNELVAITNLKSDGTFILGDIVLSEGENRFMLYAVDYAGNVSLVGTAVNRTLDSTAPLITIEKAAGSDNQYTVQANEPISDLYVMFNGATVESQNISGSGSSYAITVSDLADGANTLCVWATDAAGNTGTGSYTSTYIPANTQQNNISVGDGTTMDIPAGAFQQEIQMLIRTVDFNDQISYKPVSAPVSFDFTNMSGGSATVHEPILIRIQVGLGLKGVMLMHIDDNGNPGIPVPAIEVTSAFDLSTIAIDTPYYVTDTGELVFKTASFSAYGAVVDNTAPVISVPGSNITINKTAYEDADSSIVLIGTLTDSSDASITRVTVDGQQMELSGIAAGDLDKTFSIVLPISSDGSHEVLLVATDTAGNQSNPCQIAYSVDIHSPSLTAALPVSLTNLNSINLNIQTNEMSDIYVNGQLVDRSSGSFSIPLALDSDGAHNFNVRATDALGNSTDAPAVSVTRDSTAPEITITGVSNGDTYGGEVNIIVNVTGHTETPVITLDGASYTPGSYNMQGQHTLSVTATDEAGNTATQSVSFTIDSSVPVINIAGVDANGLYDSDKTLDISASNADKLSVTKSINGGAPQNITVSGLNASVDLSAANNQQNSYLIQISATKTIGGQIRSASSTLRATIDKKAPALTVSAPVQSESASVTISGNVDETSDIYLDGQSVLDEVQPGGFSLVAQSLIMGSNTFTIKAVDRLGHETTKTVTVTRTQPSNNDGSGNNNGGIVPPPAAPVQPGSTIEGSNISNIPTINGGKAVSMLTESDISKALNNAQAGSAGTKRVTIDISEVKGVNSYSLELPASVMRSGTGKQQYEINTPVASILVPGNMFTSKDTSNKQKLGITAASADISKMSKELREQIGNKPVIELSASADGKIFEWNNPNAPVTIMLDYTPTAEELKNPDHIVVWYIDGNGKTVAVPSGRYDPASGKVIFTVTHFSKYAVAYEHKTYSDISTSFGKKMIEALASRGFFNWITGAEFDPNRNITRGEFMQLLVTVLDLHAEFESNFSDIKPGDNFYEAIGIARKLGITSGIGNNKSGAGLSITRQDMATLVIKALIVANKPYPVGGEAELKGLKDYSKIAGYAKTGLATLIKAGIIVGYNQKVDPQGTFSMQQAAVVIYKIYNKK